MRLPHTLSIKKRLASGRPSKLLPWRSTVLFCTAAASTCTIHKSLRYCHPKNHLNASAFPQQVLHPPLRCLCSSSAPSCPFPMTSPSYLEYTIQMLLYVLQWFLFSENRRGCKCLRKVMCEHMPVRFLGGCNCQTRKASSSYRGDILRCCHRLVTTLKEAQKGIPSVASVTALVRYRANLHSSKAKQFHL